MKYEINSHKEEVMLIFDVLNRDHQNIEHLLTEIKSHKEEVADNHLKSLIPLLHELREEVNCLHKIKQQTIYNQIYKIFKNNLDIMCVVEEHNCLAAWMDHCINTLEKNDTLKGFAQFCIAARMLRNHFKYEKTQVLNTFLDSLSGEELEKIGENYESLRIQHAISNHL